MMAAERSRGGAGRSQNASETTSSSEVSSPEVSTPPPEQPLPTGLSALIEAATSQLGHLAEAASILQRDEAASRLPSVVLRSSVPLNNYSNFPERLMGLCCDPANLNTITFLPDGKFFAVRHSAFEETILSQQHHPVFDGVTTCSEFLSLAQQWGFSTFQSSATPGITILRHPKFVSGDYEQCRTMIRYGETPEAVRVQALPERARSIVIAPPPAPVEESTDRPTFTITTRSRAAASPTPPKRRLSPRRESFPSTVASKQRLAAEQESLQQQRRPSPILMQDMSSRMDEDSVRSVAKAIAANKISMQPRDTSASSTAGGGQHQHQQPTKEHPEDGLVETAVTSATQEIVSEAIESLLRDEGHSKETFLKHEKELSRSSIPGVVPVCKQLFSSTYKDALSIIAASVHDESTTLARELPDEQKPSVKEEDESVLQEASANSATSIAAEKPASVPTRSRR